MSLDFSLPKICNSKMMSLVLHAKNQISSYAISHWHLVFNDFKSVGCNFCLMLLVYKMTLVNITAIFLVYSLIWGYCRFIPKASLKNYYYYFFKNFFKFKNQHLLWKSILSLWVTILFYMEINWRKTRPILVWHNPCYWAEWDGEAVYIILSDEFTPSHQCWL